MTFYGSEGGLFCCLCGQVLMMMTMIVMMMGSVGTTYMQERVEQFEKVELNFRSYP